jgi:alkanesulfonate monooxygenase SsuD/methylene tetrahydromethanopterin reductase-like flavin-dependent oxidoreductase (luciferase family)
MKFHMMHLMPYADLDPSYSEKYPSSWLTLPNSYYDPKKGAKLYNRYIDELVYADTCGFDGVCVNEHHSNAYGLMPIPGVIAGALARATKKATIAVLGRALPLLNNPLTVAEEYAMLDNITEGRLIAGFVRGIGAEYHAWSSNPANSHERFHEAHDMIVRAWAETEPFAFYGKHYQFNYVNVWPRVYQQPRPKIWIPSQGSTETIQWAADASRRYTYLQTFSPLAALRKYMTMYREQADKNGWTAGPEHMGWSCPVYVAETDEQARAEAKPHIEFMFNKLLRMTPEMLLPPGYTSVASIKGMLLAKGNVTAAGKAEKTIDDLIASGMFLCGSPATVREQITTMQKELGFGVFISLMQFGSLPHELTMTNIRTFADDVIPHIRPLGETVTETAEA